MNNLREIAQKFKTIRDIIVTENEEMSRHFSFKVGGVTPLLVEPETTESFLECLNLAESEKVPYFILGGGTNIVFSDSGFDGAVISTGRLNKVEIVASEGENVTVRALCGAQMNAIVNFCTKNGLSGLEEFCGLPGTCGGAAYMNARCFNREISDVAENIEYADLCGANSTYTQKILNPDKTLWSYKKSPFTDTKRVVYAVEFKLTREDGSKASQIAEKAASFMKERVDKGHFKFPCAGSVFKNNHDFGAPTGQIIDGLGLKGTAVGGAQVAPFHGNIIINTGAASASDIKALVELVKKEVREKKGFELEEEIIFK
ncbi:MAG: UDP-N-acetylmuramate dehydrogenase [Treponema sp.]|nr:UDP-N-acetylmuramate dehydrogenase [Candidatus Treponema merdequi]